MASFTTTNVSSNLVGREHLAFIASEFVKQYYTLLNKAPCYIYNFYSQDSTFIHGTIDLANDQHNSGPIIGRENIKSKMEDLKLSDCRAKIKQIDCLETLAGGLVIQVIGELSNNGEPMRRFLQTFVLAPSPDESSHNHKFYVLNSIFRYQDDGPDNELHDETNGVQTNVPADGPITGTKVDDNNKVEMVTKQQHENSSTHRHHHHHHQQSVGPANGTEASVDRLANDLDDSVKLNKHPTQESELKRDLANNKVVSNGTGEVDKKNETSEKVAENSKTTQGNINTTSGPASVTATSQNAPAARPQPSNEPKTWATMVRNYQPSAISTQVSASKPSVTTPQIQGESQQQLPNSNQQSSSVQAHQQSPQNQQQQNSQNNNNSNNNSNSNRRRHTMRKSSNKSNGGRTIKSRPPRPPTAGKPAA